MAGGAIERKDVISDEAFEAPLLWAERFEKVAIELDKIVNSAAGAGKAISSSNVSATQKKAVDDLARAEQRLAKANTDLAKQVALVNEQATIKRRQNREEAKQTLGLVGAYDRLSKELNEARKAYKDLAASGKASTKALEDQRKVVTDLDRRIKRIDAATGQFQRNVGNYPKVFAGAGASFAKFGRILRGVIGAFGIIEGLRFGVEFIKESKRVSDEALGIEFAFRRLGQAGVKAFNDIKEAVRGSISDLDIKRSLNEFANFNITLDQSGTLFEFLAIRAAQTGKSIVQLRDSLVEGLSKESLLRIDNLGISTAALNEELKKTPNFVQAVANIAKREIAKAGDILDSAVTGQAKWNAELENFKLILGSGPVSNFANQVATVGAHVLRIIGRFVEWVKVSKTAYDLFRIMAIPITSLIRAFQIFSEVMRRINTSTGGKFVAFLRSMLQPLKDFVRFLAETPNHLTGFAAATLETWKVVKDATITTFTLVKDIIAAAFDPTTSIKDVIGRAVRSVENYGERISAAYRRGFNKFRTPDVDAPQTEQETITITPPTPEAKEVDHELLRRGRIAALERQMKERTDLFAQELEEFQKQKEFMAGIEERFNNRLVEDAKIRNERLKEQEKKRTEAFLIEQQKRREIEQASVDFGLTVFHGLIENRQEALSIESEQLEERRQKELEAAGDDERKKLAINKKFDREQAKIRQKQANAQKLGALFDIAVNTAVGVTSALRLFPPNPVLAAIIAATGAAQALLVAARPVPKFFKGSDYTPSTFIAGDAPGGGSSTEIVSKGGKSMVVDRPTLFTGMAGAKVVPESKAKEILGTLEDAKLRPRYMSTLTENMPVIGQVMESHLIETNSLLRKIESKPVPTWVMDRHGFREFMARGRSKTEYANKRFHNWE